MPAYYLLCPGDVKEPHACIASGYLKLMSSIPKSWHKKAKQVANLWPLDFTNCQATFLLWGGHLLGKRRALHSLSTVQEPASDSTICTNVFILSSQCAIQCFSSSSRSAVLFYLLFGLLPQRSKNHSSLEDLTSNLPFKVTYIWILSDTMWLYWLYTVPTDVHCFTNNYLVLYRIDIPCLQLPSLKNTIPHLWCMARHGNFVLSRLSTPCTSRDLA